MKRYVVDIPSYVKYDRAKRETAEYRELTQLEPVATANLTPEYPFDKKYVRRERTYRLQRTMYERVYRNAQLFHKVCAFPD